MFRPTALMAFLCFLLPLGLAIHHWIARRRWLAFSYFLMTLTVPVLSFFGKQLLSGALGISALLATIMLAVRATKAPLIEQVAATIYQLSMTTFAGIIICNTMKFRVLQLSDDITGLFIGLGVSIIIAIPIWLARLHK